MLGLPTLEEQIRQLTGIARRVESFEWAVRTATPEEAARLGASWQFHNAPVGVHLSMAKAGVDPDDQRWAYVQERR